MTLYRDMTNEELAQTGKDFKVSDVPGARKLLWAMASRLEEVSKSLVDARKQRQEAEVKATFLGGENDRLAILSETAETEQEPPPKPNRPDSLADLMLQRGLSKEARQWLRESRPEVMELLSRAREFHARKSTQVAVHGGPSLANVEPALREENARRQREALNNMYPANYGQQGAAIGAFAGIGFSPQNCGLGASR